MKTTYIISALLLLLASCNAFAQEDLRNFDPNNICIDVNYMMPQRYPTRAVSDFSLCLKGDTVISHLPYMGEAYRPTIGDTERLNFKIPVTDKTIKAGKKNKTIITFTCKNGSATYDFKIEVYPEGGAYISLIPSYADQISFKGEWE